MKPEDVVVDYTVGGNLKITVPDDDTDSLVVVSIHHFTNGRDQKLAVKTLARGNFSGSMKYGAGGSIVRRPVTSTLVIDAPPVPPEEMNRRRHTARRQAASDEMRLSSTNVGQGAQPSAPEVEPLRLRTPEEFREHIASMRRVVNMVRAILHTGVPAAQALDRTESIISDIEGTW